METERMLTEAEEEARVAKFSDAEKEQLRKKGGYFSGMCYWCKHSRHYCNVLNAGVLCSKKKTHRRVEFNGHCDKYVDWV